MSGTKYYPADMIVSSKIQWDGKPLINGTIKAKTPLNQLIQNYNDLFAIIDQFLELAELTDTYAAKIKKTGSDKVAQLFNLLIADITAINKSLGAINTALNNSDTSLADAIYSLKVVTADTAPGLLGEKLISQQVGGLSIVNNTTMLISGLVPLGSVFFITKQHLPNFDVTGKAKVNTAFWGYAVANGANGTDNLLKDAYVKMPATTDDASKETGSANFTVKKDNIESLNIKVTGTLASGLGATVVKTAMKKESIPVPAGGSSTQKVVYTPNGTTTDLISSESSDLAHVHNYDLKADHVNNALTPIALTPKAFNLIPIQKINV